MQFIKSYIVSFKQKYIYFIFLVTFRAAMVIQGVARVDSSFIQALIEFNVGTQAQLNFMSDLEFYEEVMMCLKMVSFCILFKQPNYHS